MTDSTQDTPQPVYFLCDVSVRMGDERLLLAESLMGWLAAEIADDALLKFAVRWGIEHYGTTDGAGSVVPIQQVDFTDELPAMRLTVEEPSFQAAADDLRRRMGIEVSQLDADFPEVRSPILVVLTSGAFADTPDDLDAAVAGLFADNPRIEQDRGWAPTILFLGLRVADPTALDRLDRAHDNVGTFAVEAEEDAGDVARTVVDVIRRAVVTGARHLRYALWVTEERGLTPGAVIERTGEVEVFEVDQHQLTGVTEPLRYRRFLDVTQDADAHPFDALLDLVALRNAKPPAGRGERLVERALWPVRLVVGDDPRVAAGLLEPVVPIAYTDELAGQRVPRSVSLLRLDGSAPAPADPRTVPAPSDGVARVRLCADLADTVDLAHRYGVALGIRALESAVFRLGRRAAEVQLTECGDARIHDPADSHGAVADLIWFGRFVERCVVEQHGPADAAPSIPALDAVGQDLVARAKSNVPSVIPSAARWRDYLDRRAVELQGPPVIESVQVSPAIAPVGGKVTVGWRTRYADVISLVGADGTQVQVAPKYADSGYRQITVTRPGPVTLHVRNQIGGSRLESEWVHVFELPRLGQVPVAAAPPLTSSRTLNELSDLMGTQRRTDQGVAWPTVPVFDPAAAMVRPERRSLLRRRSELPGIFPYDVGRWFSRRPENENARSRLKRWWRFPWG
ncbi:MAG: hypothetical protein ABW046_03855 [Actinoplanes sp.]